MKKKTLKTYRTLKEASAKYNITPDKLEEMVDQGSLRAALCDDELAVLEDDVRHYVATQITREQFQHLDGIPIMLSEAAKKYGFNTGSLWRWIGQNRIRVLSREGHRVFLNEADVAYARSCADVRKLRSGQSLFGRIDNK